GSSAGRALEYRTVEEGTPMSRHVVEPRIRGFLSLTAHPDGCAANVREQIEIARTVRSATERDGASDGQIGGALILGSSTGYGLASAVVTFFCSRARTRGVCFEKPAEGDKPASAGWYNLAEAHR